MLLKGDQNVILRAGDTHLGLLFLFTEDLK